MSKLRDLSQAEFDVMDVLWRKGQATVKEIQAALSSRKPLAYATVSTLLTRMKEKGYVDAHAKDFAYVYRPLVKRDQVVRRKLDDLVKQVLRGDLEPLAAYIAENRRLTPEQLQALEDMIKSGKEEDRE